MKRRSGHVTDNVAPKKGLNIFHCNTHTHTHTHWEMSLTKNKTNPNVTFFPGIAVHWLPSKKLDYVICLSESQESRPNGDRRRMNEAHAPPYHPPFLFCGRALLCRRSIFGGWGLVVTNTHPKGPKIEKFQDFAPGLKLSSNQSQIEIFNRD